MSTAEVTLIFQDDLFLKSNISRIPLLSKTASLYQWENVPRVPWKISHLSHSRSRRYYSELELLPKTSKKPKEVDPIEAHQVGSTSLFIQRRYHSYIIFILKKVRINIIRVVTSMRRRIGWSSVAIKSTVHCWILWRYLFGICYSGKIGQGCITYFERLF